MTPSPTVWSIGCRGGDSRLGRLAALPEVRLVPARAARVHQGGGPHRRRPHRPQGPGLQDRQDAGAAGAAGPRAAAHARLRVLHGGPDTGPAQGTGPDRRRRNPAPLLGEARRSGARPDRDDRDARKARARGPGRLAAGRVQSTVAVTRAPQFGRARGPADPPARRRSTSPKRPTTCEKARRDPARVSGAGPRRCCRINRCRTWRGMRAGHPRRPRAERAVDPPGRPQLRAHPRGRDGVDDRDPERDGDRARRGRRLPAPDLDSGKARVAKTSGSCASSSTCRPTRASSRAPTSSRRRSRSSRRPSRPPARRDRRSGRKPRSREGSSAVAREAAREAASEPEPSRTPDVSVAPSA